jgi:hypothetical protein
VLLLGGLACGLRWRLLLGLPRALALGAVFLAGFAKRRSRSAPIRRPA